MKQFLIVAFFMIMAGAQAQAVRLSVNEKKAEGTVPVTNTKFQIIFSDTIVVELTAGSDGQLGKIPLDEGIYTVVLKNEAFEDAVEKNVKLSPGKITALTITCRRKK